VNITPLIQGVEIVCDNKTFKTFVTHGKIKHNLHGLLARYTCDSVKNVSWDHVQSHDTYIIHYPTTLEASPRVPQDIIEWILENMFMSNVFYITPSDRIQVARCAVVH